MKISNQNLQTEYPIPDIPLDDIKLSQGFACRDPFIMLCGSTYYLYKKDRTLSKIVCHISKDLENWSNEITVFCPSKDFHGTNHLFWAPECHYFNGYFYIFTSVFSSLTNHRSISVYRADNPLGPFEDIAGGYITPKEWDAIDGTLYVDQQGEPWMVFVHEWISMPDDNGSFCASKLSKDFTCFESEPITLFYAKDLEGATMGVTDGCYLTTLESGKLMMTWSNFTKDGYVVAKAYSENGKIDGKWIQEDLLYYKGLTQNDTLDGGHGMVFQDKNGEFLFTYHSPNSSRDGIESVKIRKITEENNSLILE